MKNKLIPTRAETSCAGNITPKRLAARTRKALDDIEKRIAALAQPYAEIDNSVEGAVCTLSAAFDEFRNHIEETQKWLEESAA